MNGSWRSNRDHGVRGQTVNLNCVSLTLTFCRRLQIDHRVLDLYRMTSDHRILDLHTFLTQSSNLWYFMHSYRTRFPCPWFWSNDLELYGSTCDLDLSARRRVRSLSWISTRIIVTPSRCTQIVMTSDWMYARRFCQKTFWPYYKCLPKDTISCLSRSMT